MKKLLCLGYKGFTVIEVLIATAVFSVVLLIVTGGIVQINRMYYRGITESNTQNTARSILDSVAQAVQFNGGTVTPTTGTTPGNIYQFCVGNKQFSYRPGWIVTDGTPNTTLNETPHALYQRDLPGCNSGSTAAALSNVSLSGGRELLGANMRLASITVASTGPSTNATYRITVRVVYGANDLLNNPTASTASCKNQRSGSQFCAVSELSTVVSKRVK